MTNAMVPAVKCDWRILATPWVGFVVNLTHDGALATTSSLEPNVLGSACRTSLTPAPRSAARSTGRLRSDRCCVVLEHGDLITIEALRGQVRRGRASQEIEVGQEEVATAALDRRTGLQRGRRWTTRPNCSRHPTSSRPATGPESVDRAPSGRGTDSFLRSGGRRSTTSTAHRWSPTCPDTASPDRRSLVPPPLSCLKWR